jgi:S-adenosylmethionine synthetase
MIRMSEAVLDGHPDKFCDLLADRLIADAYCVDPEAYGQIEVSVWSDLVWFSGATVTRDLFAPDLTALVREVGQSIGYTRDNAVDATRYRIVGEPCFIHGDPTRWTHHVNDQCVVHGWAGYDAKVGFLPPEHYLVHLFRQALVDSLAGVLRGQGPDGKLLLRLREEGGRWILEHVLVTLQHQTDLAILDLTEGVSSVLSEAYAAVRFADPRWVREWGDVELMVNPNGPLINGGSDGDNGQTGRKLVMDFYGPRVPIGGGALSGKDLTHIDRAGAYAARAAAVQAVAAGGEECLVSLCYAPNVSAPLDVRFQGTVPAGLEGGPEWFSHGAVRQRYIREGRHLDKLGSGRHFVDPVWAWNQPPTGYYEPVLHSAHRIY